MPATQRASSPALRFLLQRCWHFLSLQALLCCMEASSGRACSSDGERLKTLVKLRYRLKITSKVEGHLPAAALAAQNRCSTRFCTGIGPGATTYAVPPQIL